MSAALNAYELSSFGLDEECMRALETAKARARKYPAIEITDVPPVSADYAPAVWFLLGGLTVAVIALIMSGPRVLECLTAGVAV